MSDKTFTPSFPIARMERRTSAKGTEYFSGYLGGARITLLRSNEAGRDGSEVWHLMVVEGKLFPPRDDAPAKPSAVPAAARAQVHSKGDYARPVETAQRPAGQRLSVEGQAIPF